MVNFKPGFSQILSEIFPSGNKLLMGLNKILPNLYSETGLFQPKMTVLSNLHEGNRVSGYNFNTYLGLIDLRRIWPRVLFVIAKMPLSLALTGSLWLCSNTNDISKH